MMDDWNARGTASVTPAQARAAADAWLAVSLPGASVTTATYAPMGYLFTVTADGQVVGTLVVDDDTTAVRWWQAPAAMSPTPSPA
ncbi:MAG: hypothetical protein WCF36_05635 [Candidatus Nanopelagicales bacterium]